MFTEELKTLEPILITWKRHLKRDPNVPVLSDSLGNTLTRAEVEDRSNRVCAYLRAHNVGKGDFVLIHLDRGVKPVLAITGILKCGCAFALAESDYAKERVEFIKKDCRAVFEINEENWGEILKTEPIGSDEYTLADDHDACLAVYTSGSTGTPKGVVHEYGQLKMELICERNPDGSPREGEDTIWGLVAPLNFVASLKILVHFYTTGGHLHILDYDTVKNPRKLLLYFLKNKINETFLPPSILRKKNDLGPYIKRVYSGSEPMDGIYLKRAELLNVYMMSESFFTLCEFRIDRAYPVVPIGNPRFDLPIKLLKEDGTLAAEGEIGEFCFYNPYCRGYLNNDSENQRHFADGYFHTGDLAVYQNGIYTLKGRRDDMIKINGNRIEPSEIEAACKAALGLKECVAKGFEKEAYVALYYTDRRKLDESEARARLASILPYYMIPAFFIRIDEIPRSKILKIDRSRLPAPEIKVKASAPTNAAERKVLKVFRRVLKNNSIGIDDDFFQQGGNSLGAMEVVSLLDDTYTSEIIFQGRTVREVVRIHNERTRGLSEEEKEQRGREMKIDLGYFEKFVYRADKAHPSFTMFNLSGAYCFRKNPLISVKRVRYAINQTIHASSLFQAVIEEDSEGNPYWKYDPSVCSDVEIEKMTDEEALGLAKTFVQGFGGGGKDKRLYRIRLIETKKNFYIYADFCHALTDGYGLNQIIQDIISAYLGRPNRHNNFFAYLYDTEELRHSTVYQVDYNQFLSRRYLPYKDHMHFALKGSDQEDAIRFYPIRFDWKELGKHMEKYGITPSLFINSVFLLGLSIFSGDPQAGISWMTHGRKGEKNHTGFRAKYFPLALLDAPYQSLAEYYADIKRQVEDELERGSFNFQYDSDFAKQNKYMNLKLDYLADLMTNNKWVGLGGKRIELNREHDNDVKASYSIFQVMDAKDGVVLKTRSIGKENVEKFMGILQSVIRAFFNDELPSIQAEAPVDQQS